MTHKEGVVILALPRSLTVLLSLLTAIGKRSKPQKRLLPE